MADRPPLPEIRLHALSYTAEQYMPRPDRDQYDLDAPYQRGSVWTSGQQAALIKSLYMGVPIGSIIVSVLPVAEYAKDYRVVDGKQRVEALRAWFGGALAVPGWWLADEYVERRADMITWADLSIRGHRRFGNALVPALQFDAHAVWNGRDDAGKPLWSYRDAAGMLRAEAELYLLINGGGTDQTDEDMDRARMVAGQ